jgi:16S rRNA (adenine1518-N6/adenine1519-N6)-dimethyltransferase
VTLLRKVLRGAFTPVPRVDSGLVLFERLDGPAVAVEDEKLYFRLVRGGFGKRRKTLRNALLMAGLGLEPAALDAAFESTGIPGQRRAETLTLQEWAALEEVLAGA